VPPQPFPSGFLWGAATAAHAVEGGSPASDWWLWEQAPGRVAGGATSRQGAAWWERADEDFVAAARLGLTALRFSVEWSRVEPDEGRFDDVSLARYAAWAERLRGLGIEPVVCLLHGTLPAWLAARGGLAQEVALDRLVRYAGHAVAALGDRVRWWLTVDDPVGLVRRGLVEGTAPPGHRDLAEARRAARHLAMAHAAIHGLVHDRVKGALVSAGIRLSAEGPSHPGTPWQRGAGWLRDWLGNRVWLESTLGGRLLPPLGALERLGDGRCSHDFIGVQAEDDALASAALELSRHGRPLLVTSHRVGGEGPAPLRRALAGLYRALRAGADLRGYLHWSLVDGFEWGDGYSRPSGLLAVDRTTQLRTLTARGRALGELARANALPER
jgi:beta-glucosidase